MPRAERRWVRRSRWAGRSRWIPAAAVLSGVIAAGVVTAVLVSSTGKATTKIQQDGPITSPNSVQPSPRTPATPPATLPGRPLTPVPSGFKALSTTWVSANDGWVLGVVPCSQGSCTDLAATTDGGTTWAGVANPAGPNATIADLEAVNDKVQIATVAGPGASGYTTPAGQDAWVDDGTTTSVGAGPNPTASLTLIGNDAWMLVNNRTIASGQKLIAGSGWKAWTPP